MARFLKFHLWQEKLKVKCLIITLCAIFFSNRAKYCRGEHSCLSVDHPSFFLPPLRAMKFEYASVLDYLTSLNRFLSILFNENPLKMASTKLTILI